MVNFNNHPTERRIVSALFYLIIVFSFAGLSITIADAFGIPNRECGAFLLGAAAWSLMPRWQLRGAQPSPLSREEQYDRPPLRGGE